MTKLMFFVVMLATIGSQVGATDCGGPIRDPGFDLWCGDSLCAWKTERGSIARVPTWHSADSGVELVGEDTAIEQLSPVNNHDSTCLTFDLVANIDDNAEVYLNVDVEGDGTLEMHERLPSSAWKKLTYSIAITAPFDGIRFELTKAGSGSAVLAEVGATTDGSCDGLTPLDPGPRPDGGECNVAGDCASGICVPTFFGHTCAACDPALACTDPNDVCGLGVATSPILGVPLACVAKASVELGARCWANEECASSLCTNGTCSTCNDTTTTCPTNQTCGESWDDTRDFFPAAGPSVCGAHQFNVAAGQPCGSDDDCKSQHCIGTNRMQCPDGRDCASSADCPIDDTLASTECAIVGVQGGSCE